MTPDDSIAEWAKARRRADVPPGFADRVMSAVAQQRRSRALPYVFVALAGVVAAARIAAVAAMFFPR